MTLPVIALFLENLLVCTLAGADLQSASLNYGSVIRYDIYINTISTNPFSPE